MSFVVLSWECGTPVGPADTAVRAAIVAAGADEPNDSVNVGLRAALIDEDKVDTDGLLDGLANLDFVRDIERVDVGIYIDRSRRR